MHQLNYFNFTDAAIANSRADSSLADKKQKATCPDGYTQACFRTDATATPSKNGLLGKGNFKM